MKLKICNKKVQIKLKVKLRLSVVGLNKSQLLKLFETCKYLLQQNQIKKGKKRKKNETQ